MGQTVTIDPSQLVWGNKDIISVNMYDPWILPVALDFLRRNEDRFPLAQVVSHQYPLEKADEAFQEAEWEGKQTLTSRVVITPQSGPSTGLPVGRLRMSALAQDRPRGIPCRR